MAVCGELLKKHTLKGVYVYNLYLYVTTEDYCISKSVIIGYFPIFKEFHK